MLCFSIMNARKEIAGGAKTPDVAFIGKRSKANMVDG